MKPYKSMRLIIAVTVTLLSGWHLPHAQAVDLLVGNFVGGDNSVKRYNGTTGAFIDNFVTNTSGGLSFPLGGAIGPDGNLYVSNSDNDDVLRYNGTTGAFIDQFVPTGSGGNEDSAGLVFRDGILYVANSASPGAVRRYDATGAFIDTFVEEGSGGLSNPEGLVFGPDGNLYVTTDGGGVLRYNGTTGAFISTNVPTGGMLASARGMAFGPDGNLYVGNFNFSGGGILRFNGTTGAFIDNFVTNSSGGLSSPRPILFGPDGHLYVGDYGDGSVKRYNGTTGAFIDAFVPVGSGGLVGPTFLIFTPAANSWTNNVGGKWETGVKWSLRAPPSSSDAADLITNAVSKTVTNDATTSGSFPSTMTIINLVLSAPVNSTNALLLSNAGTNTPLRVLHSCIITNGGAVTVTNSIFQVDGLFGGSNIINGSVTVLNGGRLVSTNTYIGSAAGASGTFTAEGGSNTVFGGLTLAAVGNSTGTVWVTGGKLDAPSIIVGSFGVGQMITSNGTARCAGLVTVGSQPGARGNLTAAGGTNIFSSLLVSESTGATGSVLVTGTALLQVDGLLENHGAFTVAGGNANILGEFDSLRAGNATWVTGGQLAAINDNAFVGQVTVSNGAFLARDLFIGNRSQTDVGTVTVAGGVLALPGSFNGMIVGGNGGTGTVWQTGGQIVTTNTDISIGGLFSPAIGRMIISNGTLQARDVFVAAQSSGAGTITVAGGTNSAYSSLLLGDDFCVGTGSVFVTGGRLFVTNAAHNAVLDVRSGTLSISGGLVQADKIILTNACAHYARTGGTFNYSSAMIPTNSTADTDTDGIPNNYELNNGLDPLNPADAALDSDGDGQNSLEEFTMGTNPNNANSFLRITSIVVTNNNVLITWPIAPTSGNGSFLDYFVQWGTNLSTGVTNNLSPVIAVGPGAATAGITNYLDMGGATNIPPRFYRVWGFID